jgi:hypothetical protein
MDEFDLIFKSQNNNNQNNQNVLSVDDEFDLIFKDKPISSTVASKDKKDVSLGDYIVDAGKNFVEGLKMGTAGLLGLPGLIQSGIGTGVQKYQEYKGIAEPGDQPIKFVPTYSDIMTAFDKLYKAEPETFAGEYFQRLGEYIPGTGLKLYKMLITGGAASLDAGVSYLTKEGYGDVAGFVTYLASIPFLGKGRSGKVVQEVIPDKKRLQEAEELLTKSREMGMPLTTSEAVGGVPFSQIAGDVASSPAGRELSEFLEKRKEQIPQSVLNELQDITGKIEEPSIVFNTIENATNAAIKEAKKVRSKAANYKSAENEIIDSKIFSGFTKTLKIESDKLQKGDPLKLQLNSLISQLGTNKNLSVKTLDRIIRNTEDKISRLYSQGGGKSNTATALVEYKNKLDEIVEAASPAYKKAKDTYRKVSQEIVDPLKEILDPVTTKVTYNTINNLIFDISKVTPTSIQKVAAALNKQDKTAFPKMAGYLLDQMITNVSYKSKNPGFSIYGELFANPKTRQNVLAILEESARSQGLDVNGIRKGFDSMVKITKQMEFQPVVGSPTSGRGTRKEDFSSNWISTIAKSISTKPFSAIDAYSQSVKLSQTYKDLATMLTSEQGIKLLKEFGKSDALKKRLQSALGGTLALERSPYYNTEQQ